MIEPTDGRRVSQDTEPYDAWPLCPGCMIRIEPPKTLAEHLGREPECAATAQDLADLPDLTEPWEATPPGITWPTPELDQWLRDAYDQLSANVRTLLDRLGVGLSADLTGSNFDLNVAVAAAIDHLTLPRRRVMTRAEPMPGEWWCWTEGEPSTFRCRERGHDVRETPPAGRRDTLVEEYQRVVNELYETQRLVDQKQEDLGRYSDLLTAARAKAERDGQDRIQLKNENTELLAKLDRQLVNAQLAQRTIYRVRGWHSPSFYPDETGLCGGCGENYPCHTRRILEGEEPTDTQPGTCLCGSDLGSPWDTTPHRKGTRGCRYAS